MSSQRSAPKLGAIAVVQGEHRNLGSLLSCVRMLARDIEEQGSEPDFRLFHAVVNYLDSYLAQFHHPKEDRYLFPAVRRRCPQAAPILDDLEADHVRVVDLLHGLRRALAAYEYEGQGGFAAFRDALEEYIEFEREHARKEERSILPLAREHLTAEDWREIDAAFSSNADPLFGEDRQQDYEQLYKKIANLAPAPYGLGAPWDKKV